MGFSQITKYSLFAAVVLVAIVGTCLGVILSLPDNGRVDSEKTMPERLRLLRNVMKDSAYIEEPIQAYIIPSVDSHQSEYISMRDQRIAYVSGFTGSAGTVIVTDVEAVLWTDSRYFIQAESEMDNEIWTLMRSGLSGTPTYTQWLTNNDAVSRVGIDPFLIDAAQYSTLSQWLASSGKTLVPISKNLVDVVWTEKPPAEFHPIEPLAVQFSGKFSSEKVLAVRSEMSKLGAQALVVSALDEVAWLLNLRGEDISSNPVFFAYVLLTDSTIQLYVHENRITNAIKQHFDSEGVTVIEENYDNISGGITEFLISAPTAKIILPKTSQGIQELVPINRYIVAESPIIMLKVIKNPIEAEGMRNAHIRDGAAVIRYLHYLDTNVDTMRITELSGAAVLREFREQGEHNRGLSFTSISAVGKHAAMAHYSPTSDSDAQITRNEMYLIDSGGQYLDGTTDITRTIHLGEPTTEQKDAFTRVLKGFISLARAIFPPHAPFSFFDAMARRSLWDAGLDYGHGTGHGVGAFMGVHEYPPLISRTNSEPGMVENLFTSNEPGYYLEDHYGIRIEDVIQVVPLSRTIRGNFEGQGALEFYDITMVPIQIKLMDLDLLNYEEVTWINEYHAQVREKTAHLLSADVNEWLVKETQPIQIPVRDMFDVKCPSTC